MRRQEIDYKKVAHAVEIIKSRGKEPALTDLCSELGLKQIPSELPALLEAWYHNQPEFKRLYDLCIHERAMEASTVGVAIIDISQQKNQLIYVNKAFEKILGYTEAEVLGKNLLELQGKRYEHSNNKRIELAIRELREETVDIESVKADGESICCEISVAPVQDSFGQIKHYVCLFNDITERRMMEKQLVKQATHDALTGLPNRILLLDRVDQAILQAKKNKTLLGFLFLDMDHFKLMNDTLGHTIGDKLLQIVANRLLMLTNHFDTVARLGGDEFVILLPEIRQMEQAEKLAQDILKSLEESFQIEKNHLKITASIGISFYPRDGKDYESLLKSADLSMYHAKDNGRNAYSY